MHHLHWRLEPGGSAAIFTAMSTLTEIEEAVPRLSSAELEALECFVRKVRRAAEAPRHSILEIQPSNLGGMRLPLGTREEWHDEMLEGRA